MSYQYKLLTSSDVPVLQELLKVFGEAFEDMATYQNEVPTDTYLENLLTKPNFITLVVTFENKVVGGLVAYELDKFEQERKEIYIYDLAISKQHRRKGLATMLITNLKEIARNREAYVIYVQADEEDAPAIALYESLGIKESVYHFDISPDTNKE